jgi:hypothetical protein
VPLWHVVGQFYIYIYIYAEVGYEGMDKIQEGKAQKQAFMNVLWIFICSIKSRIWLDQLSNI